MICMVNDDRSFYKEELIIIVIYGGRVWWKLTVFVVMNMIYRRHVTEKIITMRSDDAHTDNSKFTDQYVCT